MRASVRCLAALNRAAGRELSPDEALDAFDRVQRMARDIAAGRVKPEGAADLSTPEGVMRKAAELAAGELIAEKARAKRNTEMRIATVGERQAEIEAMRAGGIDGIDAVRRLLVNDADGRANRFSLEARALGVSNLLKSRVQDTWAALGEKFLGLVQDRTQMRDLIAEMRGKDTGNELARKGAEAWAKATEEARVWFNSKGGQVGRLDDWGFPQHHSQPRVAAAGRDAWVADVYPLLDLSRYTYPDGAPGGEAHIKEVLAHAWDSIATNGANKIEPGQARGHGARANRHAEERKIHFKDADAVIAYWDKYGEATFPDILLRHLETMARDIAFIEHFGPNPDAAYRVLRDQAEQAAKLEAPQRLDKIDKQLASLDRLYDFAAGRVKPVADRRVAGAFDAIRNLNAAGKLGSAFWASFFGDKPMMDAVARLNHLPAFQRWFNEIRLLNPANAAERRLLQRQSLMLDYMHGAMYRFGEDLGRSSWTGKMSNAIMQVSGMQAINEWRRGAFSLSMMDAIGHELQGKTWAEVGKQDIHLLNAFGITEADWRLWRLAELQDFGHGNATVLTPEGIAGIPDARLKAEGLLAADASPEAAQALRQEGVVKFLGALHSESRNAVLEPGWSDRAMMVGGLQRGNVRDELMRSFWQFKSFPIAQFSRLVDLGMSRPTMGGKVQFLSGVLLAQTLAGAMMLQTQSLLAGQDPRPMDDWKFWLASFIKGGSLGIYGDFLFSTSATTRYGSGPLEVLAGPTIGAAADTVTALVAAGNALSDGRDTHLPARLINIGKGFIPGQNLWYTKAATDHILFQNAQEALSPGYLAIMRARSLRQFGQDWWWSPGEATPERAPEWGNALGR